MGEVWELQYLSVSLEGTQGEFQHIIISIHVHIIEGNGVP